MNTFPDDNFTLQDVLTCLDKAGLKYKIGSKYVLTQCPFHEEAHPSAQIFLDDFFVLCHAGDGRQHITKAFPELRSQDVQSGKGSYRNRQKVEKQVSEKKYTEYDLMDEWKEMALIPEDHVFKNLPISHLNDTGWRWVESLNAYFIPYFNRPKTTIPFAQYRFLAGDVRFKFLKDAKPTMYGTWNLDENMPIFVTEGCSDALVLDFCMVPAIAMPSASSGALMQPFADWCVDHGVTIIYAGDNDTAGDKLREKLDELAPYRVKQPPKQYKDWADFFVAEGQAAVIKYCNEELNPMPEILINDQNKTALEILGGSELEVEDNSKEQSQPQQELF